MQPEKWILEAKHDLPAFVGSTRAFSRLNVVAELYALTRQGLKTFTMALRSCERMASNRKRTYIGHQSKGLRRQLQDIDHSMNRSSDAFPFKDA